MEIFYRPPVPTKTKPGPTVLTIKPHRPWMCPVFVVLIVGMVVWGGMLLCQYSTRSLDRNLRALLEERTQDLDALEQNNTSLQAQNKELREKITTLIKTTQADQEVYAKVLQSLSKLQDEKHDLIEELEYYKRLIVAPTTSTEKVWTSSFVANYEEESNLYLYKLVLTSFSRVAQPKEGNIQLEVVGKVSGKKKRLSMQQITPDSSLSQPYKVLYFQRVQGALKLPKDFLPDSVVVRLLPQAQTRAEETTFNWKNALSHE